MKKIIYYIFVFTILFLTNCKNFKEVQFTGVKGFNVNTLTMQGIDADILVKIKNPNVFGFWLYKSECDVKYGDVYLGKAILGKKVFIKANAEEIYSFNLKSDFKKANFIDVMKLIGGAIGRGDLELKGYLKAGKLFYKKDFPIDLKEKVGLEMLK
jgi:LEA14-like dessication related protein